MGAVGCPQHFVLSDVPLRRNSRMRLSRLPAGRSRLIWTHEVAVRRMNVSLRFEEALARVDQLVPQQDPATDTEAGDCRRPPLLADGFAIRDAWHRCVWSSFVVAGLTGGQNFSPRRGVTR